MLFRSEVCKRPPVFYGIVKENGEEHTGENGCNLSAYADELEHVGLTGMKATLHLNGESIQVEIPISGEHNVMNALAAACIGKELGLTMEEIKAGVEAVETLSGHSNLIHKGGLTIMDDCYNANPVSMQASPTVLSHGKGRKIAVLGDMGELGEQEAELHFGVGTYLAEQKIDVLFCAGTLIQNAVRAVKESGFPCEIYSFEERDTMIEALLPFVKEGDTILVKASHFMGFPKVVEALTARAE